MCSLRMRGCLECLFCWLLIHKVHQNRLKKYFTFCIALKFYKYKIGAAFIRRAESTIMDAYFKKLDEINESLDQLLKERAVFKKDLGVNAEKMSIIQALNENMDRINTRDLLLKINFSVIKTHASVSGQGDSPIFNALMGKIAEIQTKMISFKALEHSTSNASPENNTYNSQTPFLKPPSSSPDNDNSYSPNSGF